MRTTIALVCGSYAASVFPQRPNVERLFLTDPSGEVRAVAHVSTALKLTYLTPPVDYRPSLKMKTLVPDEQPEKLRLLPEGELGFMMVASRSDALVRLFVAYEYAGKPTHTVSLFGAGVMVPDGGFSVGYCAGPYDRRVNRKGDHTFRAKQFESDWCYGFHVMLDRPAWNLWFRELFEKTHDYSEARIAWKTHWTFAWFPSSLNIIAEFESYFGTGGGLSYRLPSGHAQCSIAYSIPGVAEENQERDVNLIVAKGIVVRVDVTAF